ncbi:MAG: phytoene/squalene synthase family protein [Proteobacteria bacterium]|nr:phytoene/squalene synthase family protein [Pseudomonadota bacterium]
MTTLDEASLASCRDSIAKNSKSFALASRLLAPPLADRAAVIYAWCRRADDAVDAPGEDGRVGEDVHAAVARLEGELDAIYADDGSSPPADPILVAFAAVVHERGIPKVYPRELVAGMAMDAIGTSYVTLDELIVYGYRVASTVGLMMCHVFGVRDDAALTNAAHLGIAMQLTNICRDVVEDWARGRLYLPDDLLAACGAPGLRARLGAPVGDLPREPIAHAIAELLATADRYYASGNAGIPALPWRAGIAVRAASSIYARIGGELRDRDHDALAGRAFVPGWRKSLHAAAAVFAQVSMLPITRGPLHAPRIAMEAADVIRL